MSERNCNASGKRVADSFFAIISLYVWQSRKKSVTLQANLYIACIMDKKEIRKGIRQFKKAFGAEELQAKSKKLVEKIYLSEEYKKAGIVMLYYPLWDEPDTRPLIKRALTAGKRVILPTVVGDDIIPVEVTKETEWKEGPFGIMEPQAEAYDGEVDFVLVPGVAFDHAGNRLGRGKGYYDRFLENHKDAFRLGICFDFQIVAEVPTEEFDLPVNDILVVG